MKRLGKTIGFIRDGSLKKKNKDKKKDENKDKVCDQDVNGDVKVGREAASTKHSPAQLTPVAKQHDAQEDYEASSRSRSQTDTSQQNVLGNTSAEASGQTVGSGVVAGDGVDVSNKAMVSSVVSEAPYDALVMNKPNAGNYSSGDKVIKGSLGLSAEGQGQNEGSSVKEPVQEGQNVYEVVRDKNNGSGTIQGCVARDNVDVDNTQGRSSVSEQGADSPKLRDMAMAQSYEAPRSETLSRRRNEKDYLAMGGQQTASYHTNSLERGRHIKNYPALSLFREQRSKTPVLGSRKSSSGSVDAYGTPLHLRMEGQGYRDNQTSTPELVRMHHRMTPNSGSRTPDLSYMDQYGQTGRYGPHYGAGHRSGSPFNGQWRDFRSQGQGYIQGFEVKGEGQVRLEGVQLERLLKQQLRYGGYGGGADIYHDAPAGQMDVSLTELGSSVEELARANGHGESCSNIN